MRSFVLCMVTVCIAIPVGSVALAQPGNGPPSLKVKEIKERVASKSYDGVVKSITDDELTLVETRRGNQKVTHKLAPIDLLRNGQYIPDRHCGMYAYMWADVKAGDTVTVWTIKDDGDGLTYCLQIGINRRPGGKLPAGHNPDKNWGYEARRVLNEIENGNEVSEEEMAKAFPTLKDRRTQSEILEDLEKQLAERKEKMLKAMKAAEKADQKKDDKK